jgi:hypothetical protein
LFETPNINRVPNLEAKIICDEKHVLASIGSRSVGGEALSKPQHTD